MKTALSNPELTNPAQVYGGRGGVGVESGNVRAGDWKRLRCGGRQLAQESQPRAGGGLQRIEAYSRRIGAVGQGPGVGKEQVLTKFCGREWRGD